MHTEALRILPTGEIEIKALPQEKAFRSSGYRLWQKRDRTVVEPMRGRKTQQLDMSAKRFEFDTRERVSEFERAF